jgi:hypothetical protein
MLNDEHLKVVFYEQDSSKVFPNTDIKGGVAVTYRSVNENFGAIGTFTNHDELETILVKVSQLTQRNLSEVMTGIGVYRLSREALKDFPEIEKLQSKGHTLDIKTSTFKKLEGLIFLEDKPSDEFVKILGLVDNKRVYRWINKKYLNVHESFDKYKIVVSKANGTGKLGEALSTPEILEKNVGFTESFIAIGNNENRNESEAILKYIKTKFARTMLGILKITQDNTKSKWAKVPLQDFTLNSDIDWTKSIPEIDQQLYTKYGLSQDEIDFIEEKVKTME